MYTVTSSLFLNMKLQLQVLFIWYILNLFNQVVIRGGIPGEFLVRVCHPVFQILILFQTKKCHFSQPFSDLASKTLWHHYLD